ncbi:conserved hypothetical protein [methanotrophic bacterial endosymbiont of Bathymodiolus sp.]|nr:conserved hypothetical protein [methanotrophic bacterial endosymbiont of Bathymodiolus sp.]
MHPLTDPESDKSTLPSFLSYQHQFVDYLRNPRSDESMPETLPARINVYAKLLHSKIEGSLQACFPITRELLGATLWHLLVQEFIKQHRCQSPLYREIPDEFIDYLIHEKPQIALPEFITDLAHYEWIELILETENSSHANTIFPVSDDLLAITPALNPVLHLLHYRYPVQSITALDEHWKNWQDRPTPYEQKSVILAGIRDANYKIHFIELNAVTARLIELIQQGFSNGKQVLIELAAELDYDDHETILPFGADILQQLTTQQIIIGAQHEQ